MEDKEWKSISEAASAENAYREIRNWVIDAQKKVYSSVNSAMVTAYGKIGKEIYEVCGGNERAAYGKQILKDISERLSAEFGRGFDITNLRKMRQFYRLTKNKTHCVSN